MTKIDVLDKGYVRLTDSMGNDMSIVNAARVSWDREKFGEPDESDAGLLNFLKRENHTSPFRHGIVSIECYAPLMIKNQWIKHLIGGIYTDDQEFKGMDPYFAWNESSRRYVTEKEEFYIPKNWRGKPANNKQGSTPKADVTHSKWTENMEYFASTGMYMYETAMACGIAPEQARLFLPAYALYVRWRWVTSLAGAMHFINLRSDSHAQEEIRDYAGAVKELCKTKFPLSIGE